MVMEAHTRQSALEEGPRLEFKSMKREAAAGMRIRIQASTSWRQLKAFL
jgi:hypothetical protein